MVAVAITRRDLRSDELRQAAARMKDHKLMRRAICIGLVLDGQSRAFAGRACGVDRQTVCDWVHRYNREGLAGLADRPRSGRPARLTKDQQQALAAHVAAGADLKRDGVVRFRRADLRDWIKQKFDVDLHERSAGKLLHRLDFSHVSVRPQHPQSDEAAQAAFKKTSPRLSAQ